MERRLEATAETRSGGAVAASLYSIRPGRHKIFPWPQRHKSTTPDRCAKTKSRGEFKSRFQIGICLDSRPARCFLAPMTFTLWPGAVAPYNFASIFGSLEAR